MTEIDQVYHCSICSNAVKIIEAGEGQLVCCGEPMEIIEDDSEEE